MVEIEKDYVFDGPDGQGRACSTCSRAARQLDRQPLHVRPELGRRLPELHGRRRRDAPRACSTHLHARDTTLAYVSRAPLAKIEDYKGSGAGRSRGTRRSAATSTTTSTSRSTSRWRRSSTTTGPRTERRADVGLGEGDRSSCRARATSCATATASSTPTRRSPAGAEWIGGSYYFLDLTALGRQEDWEEPKGRADFAREAMPNFQT